MQAQHLEVRHWFPENPTLEFTAGKEVPVVFGVHNAGAQPLNVSFATASLAAGYDASVGVYNFSSQVGRLLYYGALNACLARCLR